MSKITTHVLNTVSGRPAAGVPVTLEINAGGAWQRLGEGSTDADGRVRNLLPADHPLQPGLYCLRFQTAGLSAFFPDIEIHFRVDNPEQHYHVPVLLSAYGYTTYRGS
jgi:5-hydroxyisourate hydrolase